MIVSSDKIKVIHERESSSCFWIVSLLCLEATNLKKVDWIQVLMSLPILRREEKHVLSSTVVPIRWDKFSSLEMLPQGVEASSLVNDERFYRMLPFLSRIPFHVIYLFRRGRLSTLHMARRSGPICLLSRRGVRSLKFPNLSTL